MTVVGDLVAQQSLTSLAPSRILRFLPRAVFVSDLALVGGVLALAVAGRSRLPIFTTAAELDASLPVAVPLILLGWLLGIALLGGYDQAVFGSGAEEFKRVLNGTFMTAAGTGIGSYLTKSDLSRGFFVLAFGLGVPMLLLGRLALRSLLKRARRRGVLRHRVLIAGDAAHIDDVARVLRREQWLGYEIVGALTPGHEREAETPLGVPVLGDATRAADVFVASDADVIVVAGGALGSSQAMRELVWELEPHDGQVVLAPQVNDICGERVRMRPVGGLPLLHIDKPRAVYASRWAKRIFDIAGALTLLMIFSPLLVVAALRIKLHDGGPILFRQVRVGKDEERFGCFKFRTMVVDAEAKITELQAKQGASALLFKMKDDPRVTKPGRWLRRYSVDELPQLLNVVLGDMSLVGPRPQVPTEVALYTGAMNRRLHVRPGMTGLWQVSGRSRPPLGGSHPARPLLRRQLVDAPGPRDPDPHARRRRRRQRRLLELPGQPGACIRRPTVTDSRGSMRLLVSIAMVPLLVACGTDCGSDPTSTWTDSSRPPRDPDEAARAAPGRSPLLHVTYSNTPT